MSEFSLTGYGEDGRTRWILNGQGAVLDGDIVTVQRPDAEGYEPERTAYLTASVAQMNQTNRYVRLEHDVTIHTSEGVWLTAPLLYWIPDQSQMTTDQPVRIETDHMLLRGRGANGFADLKRATVLRDIEVVLNPNDHATPADHPTHVTITCDGPLSFDYEHDVATFEQNVHVTDPTGELYSDRLVAYLDRSTHAIRYAEAIGRVRLYQHQNTALSERAVYEPAIGKITLVGRPSLLVYPSASPEQEKPTLSFGGLLTEAPSAPKPVTLLQDAVNATD
jgi:LPS export ABC transporter protein LptC